jgi:hypothetical protein
MPRLPFVTAAMVLLFGCAPASPAPKPKSAVAQERNDEESEPGIAEPRLCIVARGTADQLWFDFEMEGEPGPLPISFATVLRNGKEICVGSRQVRKPFLNSWQYGSNVDGFELRGCPAVAPGDYQMCTGGAGNGCQDFRIDPQGKVIMLRPRCPIGAKSQ